MWGWQRDGRGSRRAGDGAAPRDPASERPPHAFLAAPAQVYAAPMLRFVAKPDVEPDAALLERVRIALKHRYEVIREIGRGGMAVVFLARDQQIRRDVAIKVLRDDRLPAAALERFAREIATVATLQHPHIVPLYDSATSSGTHYFVMPHVVGDTLRELLQREGALPLTRVVALTRELASALDYAHARGVIHRDVKPSNVLLLRDGTAMLADFGIASARDKDASRLTDPGHTPGTPAYMAPEAAEGGELTPASDVYSLGLVVREALTNAAPLTGRAKASDANTPRALRAPVAAVLQRALAPHPADRFATAGAFATALAAASTAAAPQAGQGARLQHRNVVRMGTAALLCTLMSDELRPVSGPETPRRVAVIPFEARVPRALQERELGEAVVLPLSIQLDASDELETVDHAAVIARRRAGGSALQAADLAGALGATDYVTGSIIGVGDGRIRILVTLQPVARGTREPVVVEASGDADHLIELVDSVARRLLVGLVPRPYRETASIAERTTTSNEALIAYLEGERHYRARRYDSATFLFNRAIEADTAFALAMHRLRVARTGSPLALPGPRDLRQRLLRHAARLPDRQQRLARAFDEFVAGNPFVAETLYSALVAEYPHDLEALFFHADVLVHFQCNWGRSLDEPQLLLEHVLRIDPTHAQAIEHLAMIAGARMRPAANDSLLARLAPLERGEYRLVTQAAGAFLRGNAEEQARVLTALDSADPRLLGMAVHRAGGAYPGHLRARIRMAELLTRLHRAREDRTAGHLMIADLELARGRVAASDAALRSAARTSPDAMLEAFIRLYIVAPAFELRTRRELQETRALVEGALRGGATDSVRQRFLLGVLDAKLGDFAAAANHAAALEGWSRRLADSAARPSSISDAERQAMTRRSARLASLATSLRADVERRRGNPRAALALMREWHPERWWTFGLFDQVRAQAYERHLYASMLEANGHYAEAVRWYEVWNGPLIGTAQSTFWRLRMAYLLEEHLGRPDDAIEAYSKVIDAWDDADPAFVPLREDARRRMARLQAARDR